MHILIPSLQELQVKHNNASEEKMFHKTEASFQQH